MARSDVCLSSIIRFVIPVFLLLASSCQERAPDGEILRAEQWQVDPDLRIGSIDDPDFAFTRFQRLAIGESGRIYTLHRRESAVRAFEPDGSLMGVIGGRGGGPGEFNRIANLGFVGDTLWVSDFSLSRFSMFSPEGEFLISFAVPARHEDESGLPMARASEILWDGNLLGSTVGTFEPGGLSDEHLVLMNREGWITDTIATFKMENMAWALPPGTPLVQPCQRDPSPAFFPTEPAFLTVHRDAPASVGMAKITLVKEMLEGDTAFVREYWYEPIPVTQAEIDSILDANVTPERSRAWLEDGLYKPEFHPFPLSVVLGNDSWIWAKGNPSEEGTVPWFAFDPKGIPAA